MEIQWHLTDKDGAPLTGAAPVIRIRREADGHLLDWDDGNFKAANWTMPEATMTETDVANFPGLYSKVVVVSAWNEGWYQWLTRLYGNYPAVGIGQVYLKNGVEFSDAKLAALKSAYAWVRTD